MTSPDCLTWRIPFSCSCGGEGCTYCTDGQVVLLSVEREILAADPPLPCPKCGANLLSCLRSFAFPDGDPRHPSLQRTLECDACGWRDVA